MITATRYHDFCAGHRVAGHENKCAYLHGHNYRIHFTCKNMTRPLDNLGRVIDFSVIKSHLCEWLEGSWDHKMLLWEKDPMRYLVLDPMGHLMLGIDPSETLVKLTQSLVLVPFNPTAEQMAWYLLHTIGPQQLEGTGVLLTRVIVEETRKCAATAEL